MDDVTKIGTGGRLYKDARDKQDLIDRFSGVSIEDVLKGRDGWSTDMPAEEKAPPQPQRSQPSTSDKTRKARESRPDYREFMSTMLELIGIAAITAGFWTLAPWLGLVIFGLCSILLGVATSLPPRSSKSAEKNGPR